MAKLIELQANKSGSGVSYATRENAIRAVEKKFPEADNDQLRYIIHQLPDGRFPPVFIGMDALQAGVHFHFHVLG